ncbi:histidine kinase [Caballeronia sp. LZ001]|uniref:histidine kinase n=2 Tax=unclassified Caballeronia TaxID=2646786 RepID=UPI00285EF6C7|nr:histidine kinase [Caballeronia sp. LZ001]MDR5806114.1 histidine kinase [Caballeronia sp. LZ001]
MTGRLPLDDEQEFALWRPDSKVVVTSKRRIVIGHKDRPIGKSLALLLSTRGFEAIHASEMGDARRFLQHWKAHALLLDTRMDTPPDFETVRQLRRTEHTAGLLIIAMSNIQPLDSLPSMKEAGFDGHVRRPCSLWRLTDLIESHFGIVPMRNRR